MNILFQSRTTLFTVPGGDTIQLVKTAEALRRKGCTVDISTELEPNVSKYDLVHLFNLMRPQEVYLQARNAKTYKKPIALSTIYGLYTEFEKKARSGFSGSLAKILSPYQIEYMKVAARSVLNLEINKGTMLFLTHGYLTLQKSIAELTDVFLPNSNSEMIRIEKDMELKNHQFVVVPNAVDKLRFNIDKVCPEDSVYYYKDCILCVSRIEGRKSQLQLIRAMKGLPFKLVIIGKPGPNSVGYYNACKKEAGDNVVFLGHIDHNNLSQYYSVAKIHALISWMETPGLASLEAGAMGCNLVITDKGDTREYFGDNAFYCEPDSVDSIRKAIINAYETPKNPYLRKHIKENFTWERAADKTLEGYQIALRR